MIYFRLPLLALGALWLAALALRWWWLERQHKQLLVSLEVAPDATRDSQFSSKPDALIGDAPQQSLREQGRIEPSFSEHSLSTASGSNTAVLPGVLDEKIDAIAILDMEGEVSGEQALAVLPTTRRMGSKPWLLEGQDLQTQQWGAITAGHQYRSLRAGLQLVNRTGAINEVEYSEFVVKAQAIADALGAEAQCPDMLEEVNRARVLDNFAMAHDIRITLNLQATHAAWSLPYVQQQAQKLRFFVSPIAGRWTLMDAIVLSVDPYAALADEATGPVPISVVSLNLDVPQVSQDLQAFDILVQVAKHLAQVMEASIHDETGNAVDLQAMNQTAEQLKGVYQRLQGQGLAAGSPLAKRLFS